MLSHSQTILQLFRQMLDAGRSVQELQRIRLAYEEAMRRFPGVYTGSGKTLIAHLVGTTSAALRHGASIELLEAALLHGAYTTGIWGHYLRRPTPAKRERVRACIGGHGEQRVLGFYQLVWDQPTITGLVAHFDSLDAVSRDVVFLRLCDSLDFLSDYGAAFFYRDAERSRSFLRATRQDQAELARRLGHEAMAVEIECAIDETLTAALPAELCSLAPPMPQPLQYAPATHVRRRLVQASHAVSLYLNRRRDRTLRP